MLRLIHSPAAVRACLSLLSCLMVVSTLCAFEKRAYAYVDPGSGFVVLQVAGSMMAGAIFYLRHRVKRLFGSVRNSHRPGLGRDGEEAPEREQ